MDKPVRLAAHREFNAPAQSWMLKAVIIALPVSVVRLRLLLPRAGTAGHPLIFLRIGTTGAIQPHINVGV